MQSELFVIFFGEKFTQRSDYLLTTKIIQITDNV